MSKSLRKYINFVLSEGVVETGKTTAEWWKEKGVNYSAAYANDPFYAYTDSAGNVVQGNLINPGDPFAYLELDDGNLQVVGGPAAKSLGTKIPKSVLTSGSGASDDDGKQEDFEASEIQKAAIAIVRAMGNLMLAVSGLRALKNYTLIFESKISNRAKSMYMGNVIGNYIVLLGAEAEKISMIGDSSPSLKQDLERTIRSFISIPADDVLKEIEVASSDSPVGSKIAVAKMILGEALRYLAAADLKKITKSDRQDMKTAASVVIKTASIMQASDTASFPTKNLYAERIGQNLRIGTYYGDTDVESLGNGYTAETLAKDASHFLNPVAGK